MRQLRVGLVGLGTVGSGVWKLLTRNGEILQNRCGCTIVAQKVAVRRPERAREVGLPESIAVNEWRRITEDPEIDVVIELIGGTSEAGEVIRSALKNGKHVVTANKALLCQQGEELLNLARQQNKQLLFEASVAGGIPIVKILREGLVANRIISIHGIINGTCNYILSRMSDEGLAYADVLAQAKNAGYAEADESLDVDGHDSAHKAAVLAALAFGFWPPTELISREGIRDIAQSDLQFARNLGYTLKLLAVIKAGDGGVEIRVQPTLVPASHVLASVKGPFNAVMVRGDAVGDALFYGRGAGAEPTASAVVADLAQLVSPDSGGVKGETGPLYSKLKNLDEIVSRYYLRLQVMDKPGVMAQIAGVLGAHGVSISSAIQPEGKTGAYVPLIFMVHNAQEKQFQQALEEIGQLQVVEGRPVRWRVEDFV